MVILILFSVCLPVYFQTNKKCHFDCRTPTTQSGRTKSHKKWLKCKTAVGTTFSAGGRMATEAGRYRERRKVEQWCTLRPLIDPSLYHVPPVPLYMSTTTNGLLLQVVVACAPTVLPPSQQGFCRILCQLKLQLRPHWATNQLLFLLRCTLHVRPKPLVRSAALAFYPGVLGLPLPPHLPSQSHRPEQRFL